MFKHLIRRATAVIEALPYLIKFNNKIIVIKYGGAAMQNEELKPSVIQDVVLLKMCGMAPILVPGKIPACAPIQTFSPRITGATRTGAVGSCLFTAML